ncbi:hypothetical protein D3C84_380660 [compost metagenome]
MLGSLEPVFLILYKHVPESLPVQSQHYFLAVEVRHKVRRCHHGNLRLQSWMRFGYIAVDLRCRSSVVHIPRLCQNRPVHSLQRPLYQCPNLGAFRAGDPTQLLVRGYCHGVGITGQSVCWSQHSGHHADSLQVFDAHYPILATV